MANEAGKLLKTSGKYMTSGGKDNDEGGNKVQGDESLDDKRHNRSYNPLNDSKPATISSQLNEDAAKYRKPSSGS